MGVLSEAGSQQRFLMCGYEDERWKVGRNGWEFLKERVLMKQKMTFKYGVCFTADFWQ